MQHVVTVGEAADSRRAFSEGGHQQCTVRDGFVAGYPNSAIEAGRAGDAHSARRRFVHKTIVSAMATGLRGQTYRLSSCLWGRWVWVSDAGDRWGWSSGWSRLR